MYKVVTRGRLAEILMALVRPTQVRLAPVRLGLALAVFSTATAAPVFAPPVFAQSIPVWKYHVTADGRHPNGEEQAVIWYMNRARANPGREGRWLATESDDDVRIGREYFNVNTTKLIAEFNAIDAAPPAAFDRRLYEAAKVHGLRQRANDTQNHDGQLEDVTERFDWKLYRGSVYSYSQNGLNAHAAFNIDWGFSADGMQNGRGHRIGLMNTDADYTNVGVSRVKVRNPDKDVGPNIFVVNYVRARQNLNTGHRNKFVVGTVWTDKANTAAELNGRYDTNEGIGDVEVILYSLKNGRWEAQMRAFTPSSGGYAIPITGKGRRLVQFNFDGRKYYREFEAGQVSVLVDLKFTDIRSNRSLNSPDDKESTTTSAATAVRSAN